jgi:hypothetical protein
MLSLCFSAPYAICAVRAKPLIQRDQHLKATAWPRAAGNFQHNRQRRLAAGVFTSTMLLDKFAVSQ